MATPLKLNTSGAAPRRVTLRPSAPPPTSKVRLLGSNGKAIEPKKKAPAPAAEEAPAPSSETAALDAEALKAAEEADRLAQEEYERQMEEYNKQMEEYNRQMAEFQAAEEARLAAEAEAARQAEEARLAAEAEAARQAEEARLAEEARKAAEAAAQPAATPTPAAKPAAAKPKLTVARPAGLKPGGISLKPAGAKLAAPKPAPAPAAAAEGQPAETKPAPKPKAKKAASVPAPAPEDANAPAPEILEDAPAEEAELTEEDLAARDAYLESLQKQAEAPKIWKTPMFKYGCIGLGAVLAGLGVLAFFSSQKNKAIEEHRNYINQYLNIAQNLNKQGIETLADVKEKNVKFDCPPEAAKDLLSLVVDPYVKRADGKNKFGANPEGVAQNACLVLAIAAEQNPDIDKLIFTTLGEKCDKMKPTLFSWLLQRVSISNNKGVKGKLKKLAKAVAAKPDWKKKTEVLSAVWSCIGLRVSARDVDEIIALLKDDATDSMLTKTLCICLCNVIDMMEGSPERATVADDIFEKTPTKERERLIDSLAKAASPKALEFFKQEMEADETWTEEGQLRFANAVRFFASYGNDEILDYLLELKEKAGDNAGYVRAINGAIQTAFVQNRERSNEDAKRYVELLFDKIHEDTSAWDDIINRTDPDAADFVGEGTPEYEELMQKKADLETCRKQKRQLINSLATLRDFKWVTGLLEGYANDADSDIAMVANAALEKTRKNTAAFMQLQSRFKARGQQQATPDAP